MPPSRSKILIIDDEREILRFLSAGLGDTEFELLESSAGKEGIQFVATFNPDLVLLDIGLPDLNGIDVIRRVREWSQVPIIVLSARGDEESKIKALELGADDYITKPFSVGELKARIRAHLRRTADVEGSPPVVTFGNIEVRLVDRVVRKAGQEVHLTPLEFDLLALLVRNSNKVMSHRLLLSRVWGAAYADQTQYLRVFMGTLRHKLEDAPADPKFFRTEPGVGYRLVTE